MSKRISKRALKAKRARAAKKGWETRRKKARSLAAKKGWETRRKKAAAIEEKRYAVDFVDGPHHREALTKLWDGYGDIDYLADTVKKSFPYAEAWQWSLRLRFVSDTDTGEGEDRWVSRAFDTDFDRAVTNIKDYLEVFTSGKMNYGLVTPIQVTCVVSEGY